MIGNDVIKYCLWKSHRPEELPQSAHKITINGKIDRYRIPIFLFSAEKK